MISHHTQESKKNKHGEQVSEKKSGFFPIIFHMSFFDGYYKGNLTVSYMRLDLPEGQYELMSIFIFAWLYFYPWLSLLVSIIVDGPDGVFPIFLITLYATKLNHFPKNKY